MSVVMSAAQPQAAQIEDALQNLADQQPIQVALDAQAGHCQQDKQQPHQQGGYIDEKQPSGHSQSLQNAGQGVVQIEEGTDQAQGADEMSRQRASVQPFPQEPAGEQEKAHAGKTQDKAIFYRAQNGPAYTLFISLCIALGDHGQQHDRYGASQGIRKKDHGESHAGQHTVHTEGGSIVIAIAAQPCGDGHGFHALQQIQYDPVGSQGDDHAQQLSIAGDGCGM